MAIGDRDRNGWQWNFARRRVRYSKSTRFSEEFIVTKSAAAKTQAPVAASGEARFVKIGADGAELDASAPEWAAVLDTRSNLIWSAQETDRMNWADAKAYVADLELTGAKNWRLPSVEELFLLADRTRYNPAIDTDYFPACQSSWYWTGTPDVESPAGYAWVVYFDSGGAGYDDQSYHFCVRACRPRQ
jgi:Protein of unknown function (DUF1566)